MRAWNARWVALGVLLAAAFGVAAAPEPARAQANIIGQWRQLSYTSPINPIHVGLLRSGRVLLASGSENDPTHTIYRAAVWDPVAGTFSLQNVPWDLFCNGMSFLPDGRVLITGGTLQYTPGFRGIKTTTIFDPVTENFIQVQDMAHGRWYPSNALLSDGKTMTFSGWLESAGVPNRAVELYDVPTGWSPEFTASWTPPLYPWLHLLPSGKVFYSGSSPDSRIFDPINKTWSAVLATTKYGLDRRYGSSVLLPLRPEDNYRPRVMIMGGNNPATASAEVIDLSAASPAWRTLPSMSAPRIEMSAVILPTGKVLAVNGSSVDNDPSTASLGADLFDPATETWSPAGRAALPRLYHSVALLLPDATVWVAGSNPMQGTWENRMEIYAPAYLFMTDGAGNAVAAPRPTIGSAPTRVGYNANFQVQTPNAADIASVVFIRPGSNTHAFDFDQRLVGLSFTSGSGALTVTSPPNSNIAPPGYYMLFLVDKKGVPSVAKFVQVAANPANQPPRGSISNPTADVTITAGQSVTFAGDGTDADGSVATFSWVFPGGSPVTSTSATPGAVTFSTPGTYVVSLTVTDNLGDNDPSPPTRTITVQGSGGPPGGLTIGLTSPVAGETVSGITPVNIWVEPGGTAPYTYTLTAAGATVGSMSSPDTHVTPGWDTTKTPDGAQTLTVTVKDANGKTGSASVNVTVKNGTGTPPPGLSASFTSPAEGATVSQTVTVGMSSSGTAAGNISYKLAIDGSVVAVQTTAAASVSYSWDTTTYSNAAHTLTLTVTDSANATATATRNVTVNNNTGPPAFTVSLTSPRAGETVSGTTSVNIWLGPGGTAPYSYTMSAAGATVGSMTSSETHVTPGWDTTKTANGAQTLTVNVTDANSKTGSTQVNVTVQNGTAPPPKLSASFTSPAEGVTVSQTVTVGMSSSGAAAGNISYQLAIDGSVVSTQTSTAASVSYSWDTKTYSNAAHTLTLTVTDSANATATATRNVTVNNNTGTPAFTVSLTSPRAGETVSGTTPVNIWLGPGGTAPYSYTLSAAGATVGSMTSSETHVTPGWDTTKTADGAQTLTVNVSDANGKTGSTQVNVTVQNGTTPPSPPPLSASFTSPADGATVSGTVSVGMSAGGGSPAYTYALTVDNAQVFSTSSSATSASFNWDTTTVASGGHTLGLKVTDSKGATATASRNVTVGAGGGGGTLNIGLTSPSANETVTGTVWANVWVGTPAGTPPYTFTLSVGATTVWTESSSEVHVTLPWDTTKVANGSQTFKATVKDSAGATGSATVNVVVQNP